MSIMPGVVWAALAGAPQPPTLPDLSGAEPQVTAAIEKAHARVLADLSLARRWGRYATLLGVHEYAADSVIAYETAGRLDPTNFRWPYLCGVRLAQENPEASLAAFERALKLNDRYVPLLVGHAMMMTRQGDSEAAIAAYRRVIELNEQSVFAHARLGQRLLEAGELEQAEHHVRRAMELDPHCRAALTAYVMYCRIVGDRAAAAESAQRAAGAATCDPPDTLLAEVEQQAVGTTAVLARVEGHLRDGRRAAARRELTVLIEGNPASAPARSRLAELLLENGAVQAALDQYREALVHDPALARARLGLARALSRSDRTDEARAEYEALLADHPTSADAHNGLALCLAKSGDLQGAAESFRRAVVLAPANRRLRAGYGQSLYYLGKHDLAVEVLSPLVGETLEPDDVSLDAAAHLALAYAQLGRSKEASEVLVAALAVAPRRADLRRALADHLITDGRHAEAVTVLQQGLDLRPDAGNMAMTLARLLATSPSDEVRDGPRALDLAEHWVDVTNHRNVTALEVLAYAYAEVGRFDDAIATAQQLLTYARRNDEAQLADDIANRLELFRQGKPYRLPLTRLPATTTTAKDGSE